MRGAVSSGRVWIAVVLVLGALAAASCGQTDVGITTKVKAKFAADDTVKANEIDVTTKGKVVTLTGNVDSQEMKDRAMQLARETEGVADVVDMISVRTSEATGDAPAGERTFGETIDDAGITMEVKGKLLGDDLVKGLKIDVDTRDRVVFLTGNVRSDAEKDQAIKLARETEGVKDVQANLTVEPK